MASRYNLPPPEPLEIHGVNAAERWKKFKRAWNNYSIAIEVNTKSEQVQVATLLTVIGEEAREVFATFAWESEGDEKKIATVLDKFGAYCQPRRNIPFERYRFNRRAQEPGESYEQYRTSLRILSETCDFHAITPEEILRDRLVFGIQDDKVRERLLREADLTLKKTDEICRAAESMAAQMKIVGDTSGQTMVNVIKTKGPQTPAHKRFTQSQYNKANTGKQTRECWNCGQNHEIANKESCPAYGKECKRCHKKNHFASKCWSKISPNQRTVRVVDTEENEDEVFPMEVAAIQLDDSQLITLKIESGNYIRFQPDTGAQCNVIPLTIYKKATRDVNLSNVTLAPTCITAYGGHSLQVAGSVRLKVWRGDYHCKLDCKLVDCDNIRPLLGRKACLGMNIITYLDNDSLSKPNTQNAAVFTLETDGYDSKEQLIAYHPRVFEEGVGMLKGDYSIRLSADAVPTQHSPRRVPAALRDSLKNTLNDLVKQQIITPVTEPTPWINSIVVVPKKNGSLRICLDPKDLNRYIQRENYQLPTIEDVAMRLDNAKIFTVLDVRSGFWHVQLDSASSLLTTFHTPFGRYRWLRMPFGISSAPEIFQRRMHELVEGLTGVEVVADDFVVIGFGDTVKEAGANHDRNLAALLSRCEQSNVKLNPDKIKFKQDTVPFIGHLATKEGLRVDPEKVRAVLEMPVPKDVTAVQRLLGFTQYLSKFLPCLSDVTKPLRELTQKDAVWVWDHPQQAAVDKLKQMVTKTPVLRYYSLQEEVTIQCDASQTGLGAALLQNDQPVAYASRALTATEVHYAQIEKELLAIVFACQHFDAYIFGRQTVHVETDHKPLVSIVKKPLHKAPSRLQRMLLKLQRYSLTIKYKAGKFMFMADTLSRAYLPATISNNFVNSLEEVDHTVSLSLSAERLEQVRHTARNDPILQQLRKIIQQGWPESKRSLAECLHPYYDYRDELITQDDLVFKGDLLVIPAAMRKEMIAAVHATHIGVDGCVRRARDTMFWPRMTTELREYISKCDICLSYRPLQSKEPLLQHDIPDRPWAKIGADFCELNGRMLLVVCDYYSNYIEVESLQKCNSSGTIKAFKVLFARYGVPDTLVSDNGPQFASKEFSTFAKTWGFVHITSSPGYPQSNGKAENAVRTVKRLFKKCHESGESEFLALLDWRNTPTEGIGLSPAQRFLGRRCKTLLPVTVSKLQPTFYTDKKPQDQQRERQKTYYNQHTKELKPIQSGQTVRIRLPGKSTWSTGVCKGRVGPRSYKVQVGATIYRRNRRHVMTTKEKYSIDDYDDTPVDDMPQHQASPDDNGAGLETSGQQDTQLGTETPLQLEEEEIPRRSGRNRSQPKWMEDYVALPP